MSRKGYATRLRKRPFKIGTVKWRVGHFNAKRIQIDVVIHVKRRRKQRIDVLISLFEFPVPLDNLCFHGDHMRVASLSLKALSFRIGRLSKPSLGTLPGHLRSFGLPNRRAVAPNGFSLSAFTLSSGYA